jgi:MscS family membrane protein
MLKAHPEIDQRQVTIVNLLQFSPSALDIMIYTFTNTTHWVKYHEVKQDVMLLIAAIVDQHGAQIALPNRMLHMAGADDFAGMAMAGPLGDGVAAAPRQGVAAASRSGTFAASRSENAGPVRSA